MKSIYIKLSVVFFYISISLFSVNGELQNAIENTENKEYTLAFEEFMSLAELGNSLAMSKISELYLLGNGVEADRPKSYAWLMLADSFNPKYKGNLAAKKFSTKEKSQGEDIFNSLLNEFGPLIYQKNLSPEFCEEKNLIKMDEDEVSLLKRVAPIYPSTGKRKNVNGYVFVGYEVNQQGDVTDVDLISEFPKGFGFSAEAIRATKNFKHVASLENEKQARYYTYNFNFSLGKWSKRQAEHGKLAVSSFIKLANLNNAEAQFLLATAIPTLYKATISKEKRSELLEISAKNGYAKAQLHLGLRLVNDKNCLSNKEKGIRWIQHAANNGDALASKYIEKYVVSGA